MKEFFDEYGKPLCHARTFRSRHLHYVRCCLAVLMPHVRGTYCAMTERVYQGVLTIPGDMGLMRQAFLTATAAHKAMDCRKKCPAGLFRLLLEIRDFSYHGHQGPRSVSFSKLVPVKLPSECDHQSVITGKRAVDEQAMLFWAMLGVAAVDAGCVELRLGHIR